MQQGECATFKSVQHLNQKPQLDCEGWWLSGCHSSVAEHWPGVLGSIPGGCRPFNVFSTFASGHLMFFNLRGHQASVSDILIEVFS